LKGGRARARDLLISLLSASSVRPNLAKVLIPSHAGARRILGMMNGFRSPPEVANPALGRRSGSFFLPK